MDTEFINLFIAKQKALIDDLQSRLLLSETKTALLEKRLEESSKKIEALNETNSRKKAEKL